MLIRVSGGSGGIGKYLKDGIKLGCSYTRRQLDKRVTLRGDLALTESIIGAMPDGGEKYLHITLSFKEDHLPEQALVNITNEFYQFTAAAYRGEEINFYAEAHLPKIKSYINNRTGDVVVRKPHIHVVVPEINLLTGKKLNPFGRVEHQIKFLEAFQDHINAKYGLASPRDNRRANIEGPSEMISRYKGDEYKGAGAEIKRAISREIISGRVSSYDHLVKLVKSYGVVNVRNAGKENQYINVRLEGASKGINLKEFVFSRQFIEMPNNEKLAMITRPEGYVENKHGWPTPQQIAERLEEWHAVRAREVKHLNSGNKKLYRRYKEADESGRLAILAEREKAFYEKHDVALEESLDFEGFEADLEITDFAELDNLAPCDLDNESDQGTAVESMLAEIDDQVHANAELDELYEIKFELDAKVLLAILSQTHGLPVDKYEVTKGRDGTDRIRCGSRNLNVSDFLTKECHIPWIEAAGILRSAYEAQMHNYESKISNSVSKALWAEFRETWGAWKEQKDSDWNGQRASEKERLLSIRLAYAAKREEIRRTSPTATERRAARSLAAMHKITSEIDLRKNIAEERHRLKTEHRRSFDERYVDFLLARAGHDAAALDELRRVGKGTLINNNVDNLSGDNYRTQPPVQLAASLAYKIDRTGSVIYYTDGEQSRALLIDTGRRVQVPAPDREAVEAGLRLALQKFGPTLNVTGSVEFRALVIQVAADLRLQVEFTDSGMESKFQQLRQEQQEAFEHGLAWTAQQRLLVEGVGLEEDTSAPCSEEREPEQVEQPQPPTQDQRFELDNHSTGLKGPRL